jgi:hypothetical protein
VQARSSCCAARAASDLVPRSASTWTGTAKRPRRPRWGPSSSTPFVTKCSARAGAATPESPAAATRHTASPGASAGCPATTTWHHPAPGTPDAQAASAAQCAPNPHTASPGKSDFPTASKPDSAFATTGDTSTSRGDQADAPFQQTASASRWPESASSRSRRQSPYPWRAESRPAATWHWPESQARHAESTRNVPTRNAWTKTR